MVYIALLAFLFIISLGVFISGDDPKYFRG
jgi:hypothetical protein